MSDYIEEQVDRVAEAIAKAADADYWTDEIAEWENAEEWYREAQPEEYPDSAYEDREQFRKQARAALAAAGVAPQPEPEYEYGVGWNHNGGILAYRTGTQESAELDAVERPEFEVNPWFVVRRTPARHEGKWEPVANQSNGSES